MDTMTETIMRRRTEVAVAAFGTWIVVGLFLDGWAHNADKPETFFTPWHGLLYAGIGSAIAWLAVDDARRRARGIAMDNLMALRIALALVIAGGVGDLVWHEIFGIEDDIEALLSPTHLLLMGGGLLLLSSPLRSMLERRAPAGTRREFLPAAVSITCCVAMLSFFLQFASAFKVEDHFVLSAVAGDGDQIRGVMGILITNGLLLGAVTWLRRHWNPPVGTFTLLFGGVALLMASQQGFDEAALVLPALVGGVTADALSGRSLYALLTATPAVMWTAWFATYHLGWGLGWAAELWTGTVVFAVLTGLGLALLTAPADQISRDFGVSGPGELREKPGAHVSSSRWSRPGASAGRLRTR